MLSLLSEANSGEDGKCQEKLEEVGEFARLMEKNREEIEEKLEADYRKSCEIVKIDSEKRVEILLLHKLTLERYLSSFKSDISARLRLEEKEERAAAQRLAGLKASKSFTEVLQTARPESERLVQLAEVQKGLEWACSAVFR